MADTSAILDVLRTIPDPEMPISIVDLGLIESIHIEDGAVRVDVLPTFIGCPALPMIADDITKKLSALPGVQSIEVEFIHDPPWTVDRITEQGRASLKQHGVTVPPPGGPGTGAARLDIAGHHPGSPGYIQLSTSAAPAPIPCPFCDSTDTRLDSSFGPTRCRMIYYCNACRNSFEHLKKV